MTAWRPRRGRGFWVVGLTALVGLLTVTVWAWAPRPAGADEAPVVTRITYPAGGRLLWMDFYRPRHVVGLLPAVLVVHGGGWSGGSPAGFSAPALALAREGLAAFDVDYELDSAHQRGFPGQVSDLSDGARWIEAHAATLGIQPGRLGALGSSAGGNLVALLALDPEAPHLDAVVTWSGPMSLTGLTPMVESDCGAVGDCGTHWLAQDLIDYIGCPPAACASRWSAASPVDQIHSDRSDWLLFNSSDEVIPLAGARQMAATLRAHGNPVDLVVVPGRRHAGQYQATALAPSLTFLKTRLEHA